MAVDFFTECLRITCWLIGSAFALSGAVVLMGMAAARNRRVRRQRYWR